MKKVIAKNILRLSLISLIFLSCKKDSENGTKPVTPKPPTTVVLLNTADSVIVVAEKLSGLKEASRLAQNMPASDFSPTGFYLAPNTTLTIVASSVIGSRMPALLVGTYSRYESSWNPNSYNLKAGTNTINDPKGGIIYIRFNNDNPTDKVQLKFQSGMRPIPYYQLGKTTQADWVKMVDSLNNVPDVQLVGNKTIITFSLINAKINKNENQEALIKKADRVIAIEDSISGLFGNDPLDQPNIHKYLLTETDTKDYYMAATYYRTFFSSATGGVSAILKADNFTWGPWHELGHMHQQGAWTWSELGEVTVNVYSLAVQKAFGLTSRLKEENNWAQAATYLAKDSAQKNFNASSVSVWVRLCMFQQLKLAFGDGFYHELHRRARRETNRPTTTDTRMRWFMLQASAISGKNLSAFFRKWGLVLSTQASTDAAYNDIAALGLKAPSQDLTLLED